MSASDTSPVNAASLKSSLDHSLRAASQPETADSLKRGYFGGSLLFESPSSSPGHSPLDSEESDPEEPEYYCDNEDDEDDDDSASVATDSTLEDIDGHLDFGHPLQRMPRMSSADHGLNYEMSENVKALLHVAISGSAYSSRSHSPSSMASSAASPTFDSASYERVVDYLIDQRPDPFASAGHRNLVMFDPPLHFDPDSVPPIMVKRLHRTSPELILLLEINHPESREDPWNAAPRILHAVERGEFVFLCMQRFSAYNKPPLVTVAHYIDFFRQVLEGLSFLHEERIVGLNCADPSSYMVDLSSAPRVPAQTQALTSTTNGAITLKGNADPHLDLPPIQFDRFKYPVRYYFANFTDTTRVHHEPKSAGSSPSHPSSAREAQASRPECPYRQDVKDTGEMFNTLLEDVPQIATKFKALTKAMINGGFSADDSRRLFDALCRSVDSKVFDSAALTHLPTPDEETAWKDPTPTRS